MENCVEKSIFVGQNSFHGERSFLWHFWQAQCQPRMYFGQTEGSGEGQGVVWPKKMFFFVKMALFVELASKMVKFDTKHG